MLLLRTGAAAGLFVGLGACLGCSSSPPHAVEFAAVPSVVHPDESMKLVALVDTNYRTGSVRLGGVVKDPEGNLYGALGDSGYGSTLTAEIPWATVEAVAPLPFQGASTVTRTFVAELDENDLSAPFQSRSITVTFACVSTEDRARFGVCGTQCVDFDSVDHCGGCASSCATGQTCRARQCVPAT